MAATKEITLVIVPCWWDGKLERYLYISTNTRNDYNNSLSHSPQHFVFSLAATVKKYRPDLLSQTTIDSDTQSIPEDAPANFFEKQRQDVEGIGQPITACFLTSNSADPSSW